MRNTEGVAERVSVGRLEAVKVGEGSNAYLGLLTLGQLAMLSRGMVQSA